MKKSTSFRLSQESLDGLSELAKRFNKSQAEVLEHLITDRFSVSDTKANSTRRRLAWEKFRNGCDETITLQYTWNRGYNQGWLHFQIRHGENEFISPEPE